jgi:uncharacterized glyoxalase superfamily protein PhnB
MAVTRLFPVLRTRDLVRLVRFYEEALGATPFYRFEDVYVALSLGEGTIGIGLEPEIGPGDRLAVWLYVDDVDAVYRTVLECGGESVEEPADMPWGERVAQVRDVDGNPLYLGAAAVAATAATGAPG